MHYLGHGKAVDLATSLRAALAASQTPLGKPASAQPTEPAPFVKTVEDILVLRELGMVVSSDLAFREPSRSPKKE